MKIIVTSDEGAEAARMLCATTAEVTEFDDEKLFALVIESPAMSHSAAERFANELDQVARRRGKEIALIILSPGMAVSALRDPDLAKLGLRRVAK